MTQVLTAPDGEVFLLPGWTLEHAGFAPAAQASGHVDPTATSGSVFVPGLDPGALVQAMLNSPVTQRAGVMLQTEAEAPIGWSALIVTPHEVSPPAWTGVILKQEAAPGSQVPTTVIAPAVANPAFGDTASQTRTYAMIAPPTTDGAFLDEDVRDDPCVQAALMNGRLRTIVSLFPGPAIVGHAPIPRVSGWTAGDGLGFQSRPDNALYLPLDLPADAIGGLVERWNAQAMRTLAPVDVARDRAAIVALAGSVVLGPSDAITPAPVVAPSSTGVGQGLDDRSTRALEMNGALAHGTDASVPRPRFIGERP